MRRLRHFLTICVLLTAALSAAIGPSAQAARRRTQPDITASDPLLQFSSSRHILGFRAGEFYLTNSAHALRVQFVDANPVAPKSDGRAASPERGAPALKRVTYANLWDGITLTYEPVSGGLARRAYRIEPGGDTRAIRLRYNAPVALNADGALTLTFGTGLMTESAPIAWQEIDGQRVRVPIDFHVLDSDVQSREVGFRVGAYDPARPLFIDPTLTWNTFLGGGGNDWTNGGIAADGNGNVYVTGYSTASWQGAASPRRAFTGDYDAFAAKLDANGDVVWNTFLGGIGIDIGEGIAVDGSGNVYVIGYSDETWQGTTPPQHAFTGNNDAFVAKLDTSGNLTWSTFLGAGSDDYGNGIAVDGSGNVYVTGESNFTWQGTAAPQRAHSGGADSFVAKLDASGDLAWNTFLGGSGNDYGHGIAVDGSGNVYMSGYSDATWQGTAAPRRAYSGSYDAFGAKLDGSGNLAWNTFLGGSSNDTVDGDIAVDASGNVYVTGSSRATWQGPAAPQRAYSGGADAFLAKLDASGDLAWNTFLGGDSNDFGHGLAVDGSGNVYVTGASYATWQGTTPPQPAYSGDYDAFAAQLDASGNLAWNAFLGSGSEDVGFGIAVDGSSNIYVTGYSNATWQGTTAPQRAYGGGFDVFAARISAISNSADLSNLVLSSGTLNPAFASAITSYTAGVAHTVTSITVTPTAADVGATITVNGTPVASGSASGAISLNVGANTITIIVTAPDGVTTRTYTVTVTRTCLGAITVINNADSGAGSLRQAIADVCPDGTITFSGDMTIMLASQLTIGKNLTIDATGRSVTVSGDSDADGDGDVRVFYVQSSVAATLTHLSIVSGRVGGGSVCSSNNCGGGIYNQGTLTVENSSLSGNSGLYGGGIYNQSTLTLQNSALANNFAGYGGGGIANDSGEVTVLASTLSANWTDYNGGGIYNYHGKLMVQTSTLSGNRAGAGGGIANESGTAFKVYNSTLSGNRAGNGGGGILNYGTWLDLMHTIIANSPEGGDCVLISGGGGWATSGYGLIESTGANACGLNSDYFTIVGVDPLLGPLADNGGATQTFALLPGSPAIDAGWSTGAPDQRGVVRPQGAACDIGAFESRGFTLTNSGGDNQHTVINTAFANPLSVTLTETDGPALPGVLITFIPPGSGASAVLSSGTATTNGSGIASVTATANGAAGPYNINASAADGMPNVAFALTNDKAGAMVALSDLTHEYDGTPKSATVTTSPVGLACTVTYDGSPTPPTAVGVYTVVATVTDLNYQGSANGTFTIQDTTAPTVIVPADITAEATGATGAVVTFVVTATDTVDGALTPSCTPASGSTFPLGATTVTCTATDTADNTGTGSFQITVQDTTPPSLLSFTRQSPATSPTNADTLVFRVSFNEEVQNLLDATPDFAVDGTTTAMVAGVAAVDARTYDVTVSGGDLAGFNGTVGVNLAAGQNITDVAANALPPGEPATDQTYLLDNISAGVTSILRQAPLSSPTNASSVTFRVTFAADVQNVDMTDFSLATTGTATGTINSIVVQSAVVYDVIITGVGGDGVLDLNFAAVPPRDITDMIGNPLGASPVIGTEQTYTTDLTAPTVTISQAAGQDDPTSASPVNFAVVFSEPVTDFAGEDVTLGGSAGASTATVTAAGPADGAIYNVAVGGMTTTGTVVITIAAGVAHDAASNGNATATIVDNSVRFAWGTTTTLEASPNPSAAGRDVTLIARVSGPGGTPTGTVTFRDGGTTLGTGSLNASGEARLTTAGLAAGTHPIAAEYSGDENYAASASPGLDVVITASSSSASAQIPTLSAWGLILLMAFVAGLAAYQLRRRSES